LLLSPSFINQIHASPSCTIERGKGLARNVYLNNAEVKGEHVLLHRRQREKVLNPD
jgi:hypothetical protein